MSEPPPSKAPQPPLLAPTEPKNFRSMSNMAASARLRPQSSHPHFQSRGWAGGVPSSSSSSSSMTARHSSNPVVRSPLQQSFPAYPGSNSGPSSPPVQETPSRRPRSSEQGNRKRKESRSSSVPIIVRTPRGEEGHFADDEAQVKSRTQPHSRNTSPSGNDSNNASNPGQGRRSVKHLTCFWWWEKGECRFSDEDCLYAHYDTGFYTLAPRQVIPGEPAKAGKSLERALNKLALTNRSSSSTASHGNAHKSGTSGAVVSRPETPTTSTASVVDRSRSTTPSPLEMGQSTTTQLKEDNEFLRTMVQQNQREKNALMDTIESLQRAQARSELEANVMAADFSNLRAEREALRATVRELQLQRVATGTNAAGTVPMPMSTMRSPSFPTNLTSPWGAIGNRRTSPPDGLNQQQQRSTAIGIDHVANGNYYHRRHAHAHAHPRAASSSSPSGLNPAATPYAQTTDAYLGADRASFTVDHGSEGEELQSVLRTLGPSF